MGNIMSKKRCIYKTKYVLSDEDLEKLNEYEYIQYICGYPTSLQLKSVGFDKNLFKSLEYGYLYEQSYYTKWYNTIINEVEARHKVEFVHLQLQGCYIVYKNPYYRN